ncbi:MAG: outer membrane protein assembly factor [Bacteroidota bacterium]|nr:outer membrane protein assembly factor [Bacteroidota bacterium]
MVRKFFIILLCVISQTILTGQTDSLQLQNKKIIITPGKQYKAGSLHQLFLGEHWRDLWTTPIKVEELDLKKFGGGLTATKKGGGLQTKSLRLKGNDNNEYKFRLIDKNPANSLPKELQSSIYADIIQDQVSIGIPVSSLIVYPLMKATGILSTQPKIFFMPDDLSLGEFKNDFGGQLGIIEINPRAGKKGFNDFEDADKVINGFEIFEKTEKDNDELVDAPEFLKARLMDAFIGDRDRHTDQWQWAGYNSKGKRVWKPIPRDRDYAFARYDGIFPFVSTFLVHSLVSFNNDYPSMLELTWSGRHLDRRFLNSIDKHVWDSVANNLKNQLTNEVIENAVKQMPPEMYAKEGKNLIKILKSRRNKLKNASDEFYKVYSDVVDIYGSKKNEFVKIDALNKKVLEVKLYETDKETGKRKNNPYYKRKFSNNYTSEVRLNLLGGNDDVSIKGNADNNILVRLITGKGKNVIKNKSKLKIKLYDNENNAKIISEKNIYYNNDKIKNPVVLLDKYEPPVEDRYGFIAYTPILNYNSDDGYILGFGPNYTKFGFKANPYLYYVELTCAYATTSKDYDFRFYGDFYKLIHNSRVQFFLKASELDFNRFYGFGNETVRNNELAENNFYKTNQRDYVFEPIVSPRISEYFKINFNLNYRYSDVSINPNELVGIENPYGTGKLSSIGIGTGVSYYKRDDDVFPQKGFVSNFTAMYYPAIINNKNNFGTLNADLISYNTLRSFTDFTLLLRVGGELVIGNYPFYFGAALGGLKNLRGFGKERFLGDGLLFGQSELRINIASLNLFIPTKLGISVLGDVGRVFLKGEDSKKWHSSYGGGIWLNVLNTVVLNFTVAVSPEITKYYFATGFTL